MSPRKPLDLFAIAIMVALCVLWGSQPISVKLISADVAPIMQMGVRSAIAAVVLGALTIGREGRGAFSDGSLPAGLLVGLLFAAEFLFIAQGLVLTSASHLVVFLYSAPIFSALALPLRFPDERLSPLQWAGVAVAFGGIAVSFLASMPSSHLWVPSVEGLSKMTIGACTFACVSSLARSTLPRSVMSLKSVT